MAKRPIYIPMFSGSTFVKTEEVEFEWFPGLAVSQKQKSIQSLHQGAAEQLKLKNVLEISSKSPDQLGVQLSAFNLSFTTVLQKQTMTVECAFQGSKVFSEGGPYTDLFDTTSIEAKKDQRLKKSGMLQGFRFFGMDWPLEPKTAFYDWLYMNALAKNEAYVNQIQNYQAFTDIEFNPNKSINCQAYAAALFVSLQQRGMLNQVLKSKEAYLEFVAASTINNAYEDHDTQPMLI